MNNNQTNNVMFETLEGRTMMSAAPIHHVELAAAKKAPAIVKAPLRTVAKITEPAVTDKSITYKNFSNEPLFSTNGPTINDINQGYIGDCYLLSTLSSVANTDPALIKKDIVENADGTYTVGFGAKLATHVLVDAELPVWPDGQVAYAGLGQQGSLWVSLIEKAYVSYKNVKADSYSSINGGWMSDAFAALGLKSTTTLTEKTAAALVSTLASDLNAGDFTTFGTVSSLPTSSPLIAGHAYEVNSVDTVNNTVTLRNPWGNGADNDGYVTVSATEAFNAFTGIVVSHA